jgi:DnaK suppressor protein
MTDSSREVLSAAAEQALRERLAAARAGTAAQITALSREYEGIVEANALVAVDDEHDPEGSNTAFERAHIGSLLAQARDHLAALDTAVERLEDGAYGRCEVCGEPIPAERLEILPAVTTCVRCAAAGSPGGPGRRRRR